MSSGFMAQQNIILHEKENPMFGRFNPRRNPLCKRTNFVIIKRRGRRKEEEWLKNRIWEKTRFSINLFLMLKTFYPIGIYTISYKFVQSIHGCRLGLNQK